MSHWDRKILDTIVSKLTTLSEREFTEKYVIPCLTAQGYFPVEYHGGHDEGGKDLICWKNGDFGQRMLVVAQVKKVKASATATSSKSFAGIVNQLNQALEKKVPGIDKREYKPDAVYFITPYGITTRALQSRYEGLAAIPGVKIFDGNSIAETLLDKRRELVKELLGHDAYIFTAFASGPSNEPLLSALNYRGQKDCEKYYADLDFGVGKIGASTFLEWTFSPKEIQLFLDAIGYKAICDKLRRAEAFFGATFVSPTWTEIDRDYDDQNERWKSEDNQRHLGNISKSRDQIHEAAKGLQFLIHDTIPHDLTVQNNNTQKWLRERMMALREKLNCATQQLLAHSVHTVASQAFQTFRETFDYALNGFTTIIQELPTNPQSERSIEDVRQNKAAMDRALALAEVHIQSRCAAPRYTFRLDGCAIATVFQEKQAQLRIKLSQMQPSSFDKTLLASLLTECHSFFSVANSLLDDGEIEQSLGIERRVSDSGIEPVRIQIPIHEVLDTGLNIALLGEAGAGKTTTVEMYARRLADTKERHAIQIPLTQLIDNSETQDNDASCNGSSPYELLEKKVLQFLNKKHGQDTFTAQQLRQFIHEQENPVFIFDGVDEVIKRAPWILSGIHGFETFYDRAQVILTARSSGHYVKNIDYLSVHLLPFTDTQLYRFVDGWFGSNSHKRDEVARHLERNKQVNDIVRNPLLATILCVLADRGIPLPSNETSLYKERIQLFIGHYDIHKASSRIESHHELLELVARKIAYGLHQNNSRMATKNQLLRLAHPAQKRGFSDNQLEIAVSELIDPCNILTEMSYKGTYGFGHLRYQEFLAAEELRLNRGIDLASLLSSPWWRPVMVLFSKMTDDFESVLEQQLLANVSLGKTADTLEAMLAVRPENEQRALTRILMEHKRLDENWEPTSDVNTSPTKLLMPRRWDMDTEEHER